MKYLVLIALLFIVFIQGCYYDNKDLLDPNSACDTTFVTYSVSVNPVLTAYCIGCHSGANAPLGVMLDSYAGVKIQAANGKLYGTISHSAGFLPMPQNGNKLSDCNITKIRLWVADGAPNN
ncbi:MAG TPA: hypothetical protein VIM07_12330 [Chitinophagaceae bacterium]